MPVVTEDQPTPAAYVPFHFQQTFLQKYPPVTILQQGTHKYPIG